MHRKWGKEYKKFVNLQEITQFHASKVKEINIFFCELLLLWETVPFLKHFFRKIFGHCNNINHYNECILRL